jgi:hypothetical protein
MPALARHEWSDGDWAFGRSRNGVLYRRHGRQYEAWRDHVPEWREVRFFDGRGKPCLGPLPEPPRDPLVVAAERANRGAPFYYWLGTPLLQAILNPWNGR